MDGRGLVAGLAVAILCLLLAARPAANPAVQAAERFNRDVAVAAAATYVSLRAINAALSVVQEVEVGGALGVTGTVQPLKWLEPVDDTVERVSAVVFAVAALSGLLSLSLAPVAAVGFALIAVAALGRCGCAVGGRSWESLPGALRRGLAGCGGLGIALALGVPIAFALGAWVGEILTRAPAAEAAGTLDRIAQAAQALIGEATRSEGAGWAALRERITAYLGAGGVFWDGADDLLGAGLTLVGVFLLRMVVLPAVLLLALWTLLRRAAG